jgi:hypothetical protein
LNGNGLVALVPSHTSIAGPSVTASNDQGVFFGAPGALQLIAREGDPALGAPAGAILGLGTTSRAATNEADQILWDAKIVGGGTGVWLSTQSATELLIRRDDRIEYAPGLTQLVAGIDLLQSGSTQSGSLPSINDQGHAVLRANNNSGETRLFIIPALPSSIEVQIDIKPGSDPNCFNVNGHGVIPVAILGTSTFDVTLVDTSGLLFGGLAVRVRGNKGPLCSFEDSDGDTILDLVCHFEDDSTNWIPGDGVATLIGTLLDGTAFEGTDSICMVP